MAFDRQISAITNYCEASNTSHFERQCIMHIIKNRVLDGRWPKSMAAVCLQRMQFSEWNGDIIDNKNLMRAALVSDTDPIMMECLAIYDAVLAGEPDPTDNATHYHDTSIEPPAWTLGSTKTLETSKFIFYKNVK